MPIHLLIFVIKVLQKVSDYFNWQWKDYCAIFFSAENFICIFITTFLPYRRQCLQESLVILNLQTIFAVSCDDFSRIIIFVSKGSQLKYT